MHRLPTREGRAGTVSPRSVWDSDREEEMDKEQNTSVVLNTVVEQYYFVDFCCGFTTRSVTPVTVGVTKFSKVLY